MLTAMNLKRLPKNLSIFYTPVSGEESWPIVACSQCDEVIPDTYGETVKVLLCIVRRDLPADRAITLEHFLIYAQGGKRLPIVLYEDKYDDSRVIITQANIENDGAGTDWIELR